MSQRSEVAQEFRSRYLIDRGQLLRPGGRRELLAEMARLREQGRTARVLLLGRGDPLEPWRGLWDELQLDAQTDLLLLFNGDRWEARGWGLSAASIGGLLEGAEADLRVYYARGLSSALRDIGEASGVAPPAGDGLRGFPLTLVGLLAAAIALVVGFVIRRRMARARATQTTFDDLLQSTRQAFAEVMLHGEDLAFRLPDEAKRIQLEAAEFEKELAALEKEVEQDPDKRRTPVLRGRVQHLQDELRVLSSTILQKKR